MSISPESLEAHQREVEIVKPSDQELTTCVFIGDRPCVALLDSGRNHTFVRQDCLPKDVIFSGKVEVCCVHGDNVDYPLANITIQVGRAVRPVNGGNMYASLSSGVR